jgi:predicted transposase/invertase (TIGR01784 family)
MPPKKLPNPKSQSSARFRQASPQTKRSTAHVFDLLFKHLLHLSNRAIVSFINGLFDTKYPPDSPAEYLSTETVSKKLRSLMSDTRLRVNNDTYIVEAQISFDGDMAIRVFEYGYYSGLWEKTFEDTICTIKIPPARIIYWEGTGRTPPEQILRLRFPDDSYYDYRVETFEPLKHSVKELEKKGLAILLPFYVLKLRKQVEKAAPGTERKRLKSGMRKLLEELEQAAVSCEKRGVMEGSDGIEIMTALERLFRELYGQYDEFVEEDSMLQEKLDLYTVKFKEEGRAETKLEVAKNLLADGDSLEKVAKATGLPLGKVKALLKKAKTRQRA